MTAMRTEDPMRASGATWCDQHTRWECSRNTKRTRLRCHGLAITGLDRCRMHVGEKTEVAKAKGAANLLAWSLEAAAGAGGQVDLHQLMLNLITVTAARVELYAGDLRSAYAVDGVGALVGATYAAGRDGTGVQSGEQVRGLAKLEGDERDKLARYVKAAHDMGIATQVVELAQSQAQIVVVAFRAALDAGGSEVLPGLRARLTEAFLGALGRPAESVPGVLS